MFPLSMFEKGLDRITCSLRLSQTNTAFSLCNTHTYFLIPPVPCFLPLPVETPPRLWKNVAGPVTETHAWLGDDGVRTKTRIPLR